MLKNLLHKKYLIYGSSIVFTRGLEYLVLFFAADFLSKELYGELEYYKKVIEVGATFFAFGFPALIVSYTKSKESKQYLFSLSVLFVCLLAIISSIVLGLFDWLFLVIPFVFYALFFNGGITPAYLLVKNGSNYASYFKSTISILFYAIVFGSIYFLDVSGDAYVIVCYILFPIVSVYVISTIWRQKLLRQKLRHYYRLFKKLLVSSLTLVVSNFANLMFLYTDIFILKLLSYDANVEIANFSFSLNIANLLLLVPLTLVQVDIEKLKMIPSHLKTLNKRITILVFAAAIVLVPVFYGMTRWIFQDYKETFILFIIILVAKIFHALSSLYGTNLLVLKRFKENLWVNTGMLALNIAACYFLYHSFGIIGVASASAFCLLLRYLILVQLNKKYVVTS